MDDQLKARFPSRSAFFNLRVIVALCVSLAGAFLAVFATANSPALTRERARLVDAQVRGANEISVAPSGGVQEAWVARYNGPANSSDNATAIAVDGSGNVYVTGSSYGAGFISDYATIKYDSAGQEQWVARYNGPGNGDDTAYALAVDSSGNVYVTGYSPGAGTGSDYATIKYDSSGQEQWVARYNGPANSDYATAIAVDGSGNVYVTGSSKGVGNASDYATIKYNSAGQEQWVARYNGPANVWNDQATAIAIDGLGNVYVTGSSQASGGNYDYATIKYNSAGQEQWVARYVGPSNRGAEHATAIAVDGSGNVYVTGESFGSGTRFDYATVKYDSAGQEQWVARYNGPANLNDSPSGIALDDLGNVYVTGTSFAGTFHDYATVKYDSSGQEQWVARYTRPFNDSFATAIALDGSGNIYVTGYSYGAGRTPPDYATIKYDSAGQEQWVARYNGPGNSYDSATAIAVDGSGNVYVTGSSIGSGGDSDYATIKYVPAVQVTVQTNPAGLTFSVDGTTYSSTQTFSWASGSSHTIATTSPQSGGTGVRYAWTRWSDNGAISHTVAPTTNKTYTAIFATRYYLTMTHGTGGTVRPTSGWRNRGETVSISATPATGYSFSNWTGSGPGSYSGPNNPASITMNGPITETTTFTHN